MNSEEWKLWLEMTAKLKLCGREARPNCPTCKGTGTIIVRVPVLGPHSELCPDCFPITEAGEEMEE